MKKLLLILLALLCLTLPAWAEETGRTVILPEGTTDIPREAYAHNTVITDLYLPASLQTVHGEPLTRSWSFSLVYGGNNWHSQEYKLVLHAPAGTDAAQFAQRSGLPYVIEDARGGTDRAAVADWVQSALDGEFPGAQVCENRIGLPAVAYSADTVLAAIRLPDGMLSLCLFDRAGDTLTLRWRNDELLSQAQEQTWTNGGARWTGGYVPHEMWLRGDTLSPAVVLHAPSYSEAEKIVRASGHAYVIDAWGTYTSTQDVAAECLAALPEDWLESADWTVVTDQHGRPMLTYSAEEAFALITDGALVHLACFERYQGEWDWYGCADEPLFGVEEGLVPLNMFLTGDTLTFFMGWGEKAVEIKAVYDVNDWDEWFVTESTILVPDQGGYSPKSTTVYETPQLLYSFALVQGEQEPVVIEGNILVCYPESRTDAHYVVPEGVEIIGEDAFSGNPYLIRVTLPESLRVIEDGAFAYCQALRVVDMPSTLEYLGGAAFECTWLERITIPDGLTEIGGAAFSASGVGGTIVIPEGVTDIGYDCFCFGYNITDMYLPASLQTIGGMTFREGATFWDMWGFNSVDEGETHMTVHAPAGTDAALIAQWSGEPYVIEDARGGTDLPAVTAWVQSALDSEFPGAVVAENHYGFPLVTYSADTVFAFAVLETPGPSLSGFEGLLCCFDRDGDKMTLRWANREIRSIRYCRAWDELDTPIILELRGDELYLGLRGDEEAAVFLTFTGEDFRLTELESCCWESDTGGPPAFWATVLRLPVTGGTPLRDFDPVVITPRPHRVPGAIFEDDTVLLPMWEIVQSLPCYPVSTSFTEGTCRFELGGAEYLLDEQAMTLTVYGEEDNLILPAPGAEGFRSEMIDGRWMVDTNTVYCTFRSFLNCPIVMDVDRETEIVTIMEEKALPAQ